MKRIAPTGRARPAVLLGVVTLVFAACGGAATQSPATEAPASVAPATATPATEAPASPSPQAYKVGYISLGESIPFVKLVSDSIKEEAAKAGIEIAFCDSQVDAAKALECAQNLKVQEVQAVLNFQLYEDSSPEVCAAYGGLPTIGIDIHQAPCEKYFMGANNTQAGTVVGDYVGNALKTENNCTYEAAIYLNPKGAGKTVADRMAGMIDGFEAACGKIPADKIHDIDVNGISTDAAAQRFSDTLSAIKPGGQVVVLSLNDDMSLGAFGAARTLGREKELRLGSQGADPTSWQDIACNPQWLADAAYFPEKYGSILIPAVVKMLNGETIDPDSLLTKHVAVTKDNVRTLFPDTPTCP